MAAMTKQNDAKTTTGEARRWMRYPDAIRYSGLSLSKLQRLVVTGKMPHVREGRIVIIEKKDLDDVLASMKVKAKA